MPSFGSNFVKHNKHIIFFSNVDVVVLVVAALWVRPIVSPPLVCTAHLTPWRPPRALPSP